MTSYNGEKCEYDAMGRPTKYRGASLSWSKCGALSAYIKKSITAFYGYNAQGVRQKIISMGVTFLLDGTRLLKSIDNTHEIWYNYGVNGIHGITVYNKSAKTTTEYVFRKNVFGDVTHIYKLNEGVLELAAEYKYDAWGKCIVTEVDESGIGAINPIRYRGYYFDVETGLYYLNARYYDPETGRFISADETKFLDPNTVNGLNLYAYCVNNPVMNVDPSGTSWWKTFLTVIGWIGTVVAVAASAVIGVALTVISFSAAAPLVGLVCATVGGAFLGMAGAVSNNIAAQVSAFGFSNVDLKQSWSSGAVGFVTGAITGALSYSIGLVAEGIGHTFGLAASQIAIGGLEVFKVFTPALLANMFRIGGGMLGGMLGSFLGDKIGSDIFGKIYNGESRKATFLSVAQEWFMQFVNWLLGI